MADNEQVKGILAPLNTPEAKASAISKAYMQANAPAAKPTQDELDEKDYQNNNHGWQGLPPSEYQKNLANWKTQIHYNGK